MQTDTAAPFNAVREEFVPGGSGLNRDQHFRSVLVWSLIALVILARVVSYLLLKADSPYTLVPRSFIGGGFQSMPALLDLAFPVIVIIALFSRHITDRCARMWRGAGTDAATFLLFPLVAGFTMFAHEGRLQIVPNVTLASCLRWVQFVAAYLAWNLLLDGLRSRWQRIAAVPILAACLGFLQDLYPGMSLLYILLSVGLTLTWTVLALRTRFRESPLTATLAAAIIGALSCLLIVEAQSDSIFTFLLSLLALPVGAIAVRSRRVWLKWVPLAGLSAAGLVLSLVVPRFLTSEGRLNFLAQELPPAHTEQVEGITVSYDDVRVRDIARQMAHVIAAANQVSREVYGISPEANTVIVRGFANGGFRAEFPHAIIGNFVSQKQVDLSLNSTFLNGDPNTSIDFPDPVNGILHEYSHLYGVVPYSPWLMGTENEGWATFSATRLAHRLYDRLGPSLWSPSYNYASRANAITRTNLAGRSVYWSHPQEYGAFRLWYLLSQKQGEASLYRARWELTRRDYSWSLQINDPAAARKIAGQLGFANVASAAAGNPAPYGQIFSLQDAERAEGLLGQSVEQTRAVYARREKRIVDPTIRVPAQQRARLDIVLSVCSLALLLLWRSNRITTETTAAASSVAAGNKRRKLAELLHIRKLWKITMSRVFSRRAVIFLAFFFSAAIAAFGQAPAKKRLAVFDFENAAGPGGISSPFFQMATPNVGKAVTDLLIARLVQDGSVSVIERNAIKKLLDEQDLTNSDRTDAITAAKLGRILGVDAIVLGTITHYDYEDKIVGGGGSRPFIGGSTKLKHDIKAVVQINARLISPDTAEVLAVSEGIGEIVRTGVKVDQRESGAYASVLGPGSGNPLMNQAQDKAVTQLAAELQQRVSKLPPRVPVIDGLVADAGQSGRLVLNVGSRNGVKQGDHLQVWRPGKEIHDPSNGKLLLRDDTLLGEAVVSTVYDISCIAIYHGTDVVKIGDVVKGPAKQP